MSRLHVGDKIQIVSAIPGFHLEKGTVAEITEPFVAGDQAKEEALRELRLYLVRLDDGRHFRFRGKDLQSWQVDSAVEIDRNASGSLRPTG
jgi:hypothetical protein